MTSSIFSQSQGNTKDLPGSSPVAHTRVAIEGGFWGQRLQTVREQTLTAIYQQLKQAGHFDMRTVNWQSGHPIPFLFWETDLTKWIEAASYSLATHPDSKLEALVD